jgi:hypothetical protein
MEVERMPMTDISAHTVHMMDASIDHLDQGVSGSVIDFLRYSGLMREKENQTGDAVATSATADS